MSTRVFFCEEAGTIRRYLRRFRHDESCPGPAGYHDARVLLDDAEAPAGECIPWSDWKRVVPADDVRWPTRCDGCGQPFRYEDERQIFSRRLYRRGDTGETCTQEELPIGACWDAWWNGSKGPDGRSLCVRTPGGDWSIDDRANNCTMPNDDDHRCWVRHGRPEDGAST